MKVFIAASAALLLTAGCATRAIARPDIKEYPRTASHAIPQDTETSLGSAMADNISAHPGKSGFHLLLNGSTSFKMRLALVQAAEKTLDIQYYIMNDDTTANLLLQAILQAADRGVRVRFLMDNIGLNEVRRTLAILDGVKNIEIRIFNPLVTGDQSLPMRLIGFITDFGQATRRMHNKALISDNQLAIIGGRNLGDEYFDEDAESNFNDLDILSAGPVTADISRSFDRYWNSDQAYPISVLQAPPTSARKIAAMRDALKRHWEEVRKTEQGEKMLNLRLAEQLKNGDLPFVWAEASVAVDPPEKVEQGAGEAQSKTLQRLVPMAEAAKNEFIIVSAYFVPQDAGTDWMAALVEKGVKVRVLTNSLASTDVVAVHSGYRRYRSDLLDGGVELYEMKPLNNKRPPQRLFGSKAPPYANLHSKIYVIDRKDVIIGSFNFDPRSINLNTEISLVIHSEELAAQVMDILKDLFSPKSSYRVTKDEKGELVWVTEEGDRQRRFTREPKAGVGRRMQVFFVSMLPVEEQL